MGEPVIVVGLEKCAENWQETQFSQHELNHLMIQRGEKLHNVYGKNRCDLPNISCLGDIFCQKETSIYSGAKFKSSKLQWMDQVKKNSIRLKSCHNEFANK